MQWMESEPESGLGKQHTLNLKCVLKLVKPPLSTEMIFLYVGSLICYRSGESQGDLFVIFCIAAWSRKHLLSAAVFCYQLVSVTSTGLLGIAIIPQQGVLLKCQGSMLARCCCNLPGWCYMSLIINNKGQRQWECMCLYLGGAISPFWSQ